MCETHERYTDQRRLGREHDGAELEGVEGADGRRRSVKRSFRTKLMSPLLGYGSNFALLQFVYDLQLWSELGAKRNMAEQQGHKMRLMMAQRPMSPLYWRAVLGSKSGRARRSSTGLSRLGNSASPTASSCWTSSASSCALATALPRTRHSISRTACWRFAASWRGESEVVALSAARHGCGGRGRWLFPLLHASGVPGWQQEGGRATVSRQRPAALARPLLAGRPRVPGLGKVGVGAAAGRA